MPLVTAGLFLVALRNFSYPRGNHYLDSIWDGVSLGVAFLGLVIRIITVGYVPRGTSGRTTSDPKASVLNTTGMYSIVRHPLYLGNFFIWLGISMFPRSLIFSLSAILLFFLYYELIIFAEERFLQDRFGRGFSEWAKRTPHLFPRFKNWSRPELRFSWKMVLKREYSGFFAIIAVFTCLEIAADLFYLGKLRLDWEWIILFAVGLIMYIVLVSLKKAGVLNDENR